MYPCQEAVGGGMEANYAQNKNDRTSKWQKLMKKKRINKSKENFF